MTCDDILVRLLEADTDELEGRGSSDVAVHVRNCPKCQAVAKAVLDETARLGAAVARADAPRRVPRRRHVPVFVPAGLAVAAGLAMFALRPTSDATVEAGADAVVAAAPVVATAPSEDTVQPRVLARPARVPATPVFASSVDITPVATPDPVQPNEVGPPMVDPAEAPDLVADRVIVTPPRGSDARVTQARNSKITIVWITDAR